VNSKEMTQRKTSAKSPQDSIVIMTELVLPSDANTLGTAFGGKIMSWIDIAAATAAGRHARQVVVTASFDAVHFLAPVKVGYVLHIRAMVNFVSRTSMEIGVRVDSENLLTGRTAHTASAYTTFVAINSKGKPIPVPPLKAVTPDEQRRYREAQHRREARIHLAAKIKAGRK